jgi:hypothetical protein
LLLPPPPPPPPPPWPSQAKKKLKTFRTMIRAVKEVIRLEKENKLQKEEIERL